MTQGAVRILSVLGFLLLWELAARLVASPMLPSASAVVATMIRDSMTGELPRHLAITLLRVVAAFSISMVLGVAVGLALGRWRRLDLVFDSWLTILLNLPALAVIVLFYVWFGLNEFSAIAAVALNKLPATAVTIREGARAIDRDLLEMAASFRFGRLKTLRHVILPQLYPYLFAATRSGLSLIWKIVLVVELLGRSSGIGFQLQIAFQLFDVTGILAYTLAFMIVAQMIDWLILHPLERRAGRWRR